jgi:hypothetical protein
MRPDWWGWKYFHYRPRPLVAVPLPSVGHPPSGRFTHRRLMPGVHRCGIDALYSYASTAMSTFENVPHA